jgi:hypothetical protein
MIPYKIKFIISEKPKNQMDFESNEKPVKGEIYSIQEADGKVWDAKITEVTKVIIRAKDANAVIEYRCKVEENKSGAVSIGFNK